MQLTIIVGSRGEMGRTATAAKSLLEGFEDAGGAGELVFLPPLAIERCRQCEDNGWGICRTEGQCVIEDDFAQVVERLESADAVGFVTPVYFGDLSESMRAFLDRLRRTCMHEAGRTKVAGKPAVIVCVAGGGGGGGPSCLVSLEKVVSRCGFDLVDMVPARRQNLDLKRRILRETGRWLAQLPSSDDSP